MYKLAEEVGALVVTLEHRFYGKSYPVSDMSLDKLRFLTSEQAQADLARFIDFISALPVDSPSPHVTPKLVNKADISSSQWVSFGGSYPGNMATWLKLKYPAKVVGTVGSSAPVKSDYNYYRYAQVVGSAMSYDLIGGSDKCYSAIDSAMKVVHDAVESGSTDTLPSNLKPCGDINGAGDVYAYESEIYGWFQGTVQYNEQSSSNATVRSLCADLTDDSLSPIEALNKMAGNYFPQACVPSSWKDLVDELSEIEFDGSSAGRQWIYQSCNEFGYFQTTEGSDHPFISLKGCTLEVAGKKMCEDVFQIKDYDGPMRGGGQTEDGTYNYASDEHYGARVIQGANITMPNGSCDPWHSLGVVDSEAKFYDDSQITGELVDPVFIDGTAHCRDMYAPEIFSQYGFNDTQAVKDAHKRIKANVYQYIGFGDVETTSN